MKIIKKLKKKVPKKIEFQNNSNGLKPLRFSKNGKELLKKMSEENKKDKMQILKMLLMKKKKILK